MPAGAVPKDGPSAGVTIFTALASLLSGRSVRADTAMTGEVTLRGRVLPVGGIKAKVLAAHRAGIRRVILSEKNARDLDDVPAEVRSEMEFVLVSDMREVLAAALEPRGQHRAAAPRCRSRPCRRRISTRPREVSWSRSSRFFQRLRPAPYCHIPGWDVTTAMN